MKTLLLACAAALGTTTVSRAPSYSPMEPFALALQADIIVDGTITSFEEASPTSPPGRRGPTVTIEVEELVAGQAVGDQLVFQGFGNWACHGRYAPYALNQRAIFFLAYWRKWGSPIPLDRPPVVLGAGNEGECPIVGGLVLHRGARLELDRAPRTAFGYTYSGIATPRDEYIDALRGIRRCVEWPDAQGIWHEAAPNNIWRLCAGPDWERFQESSEIARAVVRDSLTARRMQLKEE